MSVWDNLEDFELLGRLLMHAAHEPVANVVMELLAALRATSERGELRDVQADLFGYLFDTERRYNEARRLWKRGEGPELDVIFWRRAAAQLRTVGDAIAWRFLGYNRKAIMLMNRGQSAGLMYGKEGTDIEWTLFNEHWDAGEPTLLHGLTRCMRHGDLLVDLGDGNLKIIEAKKDLRRSNPAQDRRLQALIDQINVEPRYEGTDGPSWVRESSVPLVTHWRDAEPAIKGALDSGMAAWIPGAGLAVFFFAPRFIRAASPADAQAMMEAEEARIVTERGPIRHRILVNSTRYPYLAGPIAPASIFPIDHEFATMLVVGDLVARIEVDPDAMVEAMRAVGFRATMTLPERDGSLDPKTTMIRFARGALQGAVHPQGAELIGWELQDLHSWALGFSEAAQPTRDPRFGSYVCLKEDEGVWR